MSLRDMMLLAAPPNVGKTVLGVQRVARVRAKREEMLRDVAALWDKHLPARKSARFPLGAGRESSMSSSAAMRW